MPRAVRVSISKELLERVLGLKWQQITIAHAQIDARYFNGECLELVLVGDGLDSDFEVTEGERIQEGYLLIHQREVETEIVPAQVKHG